MGIEVTTTVNAITNLNKHLITVKSAASYAISANNTDAFQKEMLKSDSTSGTSFASLDFHCVQSFTRVILIGSPIRGIGVLIKLLITTLEYTLISLYLRQILRIVLQNQVINFTLIFLDLNHYIHG